MGDGEKIGQHHPTFLPLKKFFWGVGGSGSKEKLAKKIKVILTYTLVIGAKKLFF